MPDERIVQQVNGILTMNDIKFLTDPSDGTFLVPQESAGVFIKFVDWREGTLVGLQATVLSQVDGSGERRQKILEALNEKNRTTTFGCFYFEPEAGSVVLDYHLLGDHLQGDELMNAVGAIAFTADAVDEELREAIGSGVRAIDVWEAAMGEAGGAGDDNPVVAT